MEFCTHMVLGQLPNRPKKAKTRTTTSKIWVAHPLKHHQNHLKPLATTQKNSKRWKLVAVTLKNAIIDPEYQSQEQNDRESHYGASETPNSEDDDNIKP